MKYFLVLILGVLAVTAVPDNSQRIVGGSITNIEAYPFGAAMLFDYLNFRQACGSTIINNRSAMTAAHCVDDENLPQNVRLRVGSTRANSGGVVHNIQRIFNHPEYDEATFDNDISILRITNTFTFNNNVQPGAIAGPNYNVPDNELVWAIGWGRTWEDGRPSRWLRHVQLRTVNQVDCRTRYAEVGLAVTDNMVCAGWLGIGGRGQCLGDSGGPLIHNNVVIGVCSWEKYCGTPDWPGVNARVSRYTSWIVSLA